MESLNIAVQIVSDYALRRILHTLVVCLWAYKSRQPNMNSLWSTRQLCLYGVHFSDVQLQSTLCFWAGGHRRAQLLVLLPESNPANMSADHAEQTPKIQAAARGVGQAAGWMARGKAAGQRLYLWPAATAVHDDGWWSLGPGLASIAPCPTCQVLMCEASS
jgi:hypothetical protein